MHGPLAIAVEVSTNAKLGLTHSTYASQVSCPTDCVLRGAGCYAELGNMGFHTHRLNRAAATATPLDVANAEAEALSRITGRLHLRLHVVGDCATNETAGIVSEAAQARMQRHRRAWTYTHAWRTVDQAAWNGVSVLASAERPAQAIEAMDKGWAAALVVADFPSDAAYKHEGVKVIPCVQQTRGIQCADCRLCMDAPRLRQQGLVIGFKAHGSRTKRILPMLTNS